jgi:hypothetical protein
LGQTTHRVSPKRTTIKMSKPLRPLFNESPVLHDSTRNRD